MNWTTLRVVGAVAGLLAAGCSAANEEAEPVESGEDGLTLGGSINVVGSLAYGEVSKPIAIRPQWSYLESPWERKEPLRYVALTFEAEAGDKVAVSIYPEDHWVSPQVYILNSKREVHAYGENRSLDQPFPLRLSYTARRSGTHYIAMLTAGNPLELPDELVVKLDGTRGDAPRLLRAREGVYDRLKDCSNTDDDPPCKVGKYMLEVQPPAVEGADQRIRFFERSGNCWSPATLGWHGEVGALPPFSMAWAKEVCDDRICEYRFPRGPRDGYASFFPVNGDRLQNHYGVPAVNENTIALAGNVGAYPNVSYAWDRAPDENDRLCAGQCPSPPPPPSNSPSTYYGPNVIVRWPSIPGLTHGCPLVLASDGENADFKVEFTGSPVGFDFFGDGSQPLLDWIKPSAGFLALDLNANGRIDSGSELFGVATVLTSTQTRASDGFAALAQYDANQDQVIDDRDPVFARLLVWRDLNGDAVSQPSELRSLAASDISRIDLNRKVFPRDPKLTSQSSYVDSESTYTLKPRFCSSGAPRKILDVWLAMKP